MRYSWIFLAMPLGIFTACQRPDDIQTYRATPDAPLPAASAAPMPGMGMGPDMGSLPADHPAIGGDAMAPAASSKEISWTVPGNWQEQPASSMRVGSFLIKGKTAQQADFSVVPLSGNAGGDLANINRWRGQIGLEPISDQDLARQSQTISPAGRKMLFVNFSNSGRRLMAAIYQRGDRSWFFKMTGEDAVVSAAKPAFLQFLQSLQFHDQ